MNSAELTSTLANRLKMSKAEVSTRMEELATIICSELSKGNSISISGFGTLEVKKRNERISIHPSTKKKLLVPPKLIANFKPSTTLKEKTKTLEP